MRGQPGFSCHVRVLPRTGCALSLSYLYLRCSSGKRLIGAPRNPRFRGTPEAVTAASRHPVKRTAQAAVMEPA